jgi:CRP/FNR family transcriptional regulator, cyclic AMP receptor protein
MANGQESPALSKVDLFADMEGDTLDSLVALAEAATYRPDEHIFDEGRRPADNQAILHVIVSGEARVQVDGEDRATLTAGDYFGEIMLFDGALPSATVIAGPDGLTAEGLRPSSELTNLLGNADFSEQLVRNLCARLRDLALYDVEWAVKGFRFPVRGMEGG